jgi:hypothetical protein
MYIQNPDIQNKRRLEAKGDMYNQVSLASVATAILRHPNLDGLSEYRRQNIHCVDAMSVYLFDKNSQGVRVGKTVRKDMKRKSRSISKTMNQPQSRTVKYQRNIQARNIMGSSIRGECDKNYRYYTTIGP